MRCIDADALQKEYMHEHDGKRLMLIDVAPTIEPEPKWIPCSERLPENKSYVLTTIYIPGRQPHARSGWFEDGLFMNDNGDTWKSTDREVYAWMPLPEPYREEGD